MQCEEKPLKVINGNIYTQDGIEIDNMAVIFSKYAGIMRYGDTVELREYYNKMKKEYIDIGFSNKAEELILIEFDKNEGTLNTDEICIFVNYMVMCSSNANRIMQLMNMDEDTLKNELIELKRWGF